MTLPDPELVTVGWITIDDIVLPDGTYERQVIGGGALYSAVGARIWHERVGLHATVGAPYLDDVRERIDAYGIDMRGLNGVPGNGLELWLLHETGTDKQQVPKLAASTADEMDDGRGPLPDAYRAAHGIHIAPQTPASAFRHLDAHASRNPEAIITLDLLVDPYVDAAPFQDLGFLRPLSAFLPSREEVVRMWQPPSLGAWGARCAADHGCRIAIKMGDGGSLVWDVDGSAVRVPAFPCAVVDTTGAGDAYCGGLLAGLTAGEPIQVAAAMATVSASYVVEARGALRTARPQQGERAERLARVLEGIRPYEVGT